MQRSYKTSSKHSRIILKVCHANPPACQHVSATSRESRIPLSCVEQTRPGLIAGVKHFRGAIVFYDAREILLQHFLSIEELWDGTLALGFTVEGYFGELGFEAANNLFMTADPSKGHRFLDFGEAVKHLVRMSKSHRRRIQSGCLAVLNFSALAMQIGSSGKHRILRQEGLDAWTIDIQHGSVAVLGFQFGPHVPDALENLESAYDFVWKSCRERSLTLGQSNQAHRGGQIRLPNMLSP
jgi:hypothetical protein